MSRCEGQGPGAGGQGPARIGGRRVAVYCLLLTAFCLLLAGCRQDMQDQPRYEAYEASTLFKDGLSSRPLVEGTVPRGYLRADKHLFTGQLGGKAQGSSNTATVRGEANQNANAEGGAGMSGNGNSNAGSAQQQQGQSSQQGGAAGSSSAQQQPAGDPLDAADFPFPITAEVMERGRERYEIFCAMCHGATGDGDGMIVRRGFRPPPTYHEDRLRQARVGHFFRVITEGFGAMPSYRAQIPVQDRWAITAYVRALQLSKMNQQQAAPAAAGATPAHGASTETGGHE